MVALLLRTRCCRANKARKRPPIVPLLDVGLFVCAFSSSLHIAREILDAEGLRGLYKGFGVTLCSAIPFTAILWSVHSLPVLCCFALQASWKRWVLFC